MVYLMIVAEYSIFKIGIRTRIVMVYRSTNQLTVYLTFVYSYKNCYGLSQETLFCSFLLESIRTRIVMVYRIASMIVSFCLSGIRTRIVMVYPVRVSNRIIYVQVFVQELLWFICFF